MIEQFIQVGNTIKMEVDIIPSYLSFCGTIEKIEKNIILVAIDGQYVQKDPHVVNCTISDSVKTKVCVFKTVVQNANGSKMFLLFPRDEEVEVVQRREYIRIEEDIEINCYLIGINDKKVESDKVFPARIKDISGGGVLLNSALSLPINTVLVFEIELDGSPFLLTVKILRNIENESDGTRNLGCTFLGLDDGDRQKITAYCAKRQMVLKRRASAAK